MPKLELPTVLKRPPPSRSPALPSSPTPSRNVDADGITPRTQSPDRLSDRHQPETPDPLCEPTDRDDEDQGQVRLRPRGKKKRREPRWRRTLRDWKLLLSLENSGSVARDHLASERTFLAYARTSLTIASTGVALVQLFTLSSSTVTMKDYEKYARPLGAVMIGLGMFTLSVGVARYFLVQDALIRGVYPVARVTPTLLSFVLLSVVIVVFVIILVAH